MQQAMVFVIGIVFLNIFNNGNYFCLSKFQVLLRKAQCLLKLEKINECKKVLTKASKFINALTEPQRKVYQDSVQDVLNKANDLEKDKQSTVVETVAGLNGVDKSSTICKRNGRNDGEN